MTSNTRFAFETQVFDFVAKHIWPVMRPFAARHLSRRCRRCLLSERCTGLDSQGVCAHCRQHDPTGEDQTAAQPSADLKMSLDGLLREYQRRGHDLYDALLMFSGGKDSTYLLHRLRTEFPGLRLLLVSVDNGFMSPYAIDNIRGVLDHFDVDAITFKVPLPFTRKLFRHAMTHLNEEGGYGTVDRMDGYLTHDVSKNLAARLQIPLVISGLSRTQVQKIFKLESFEMPPEIERQKAVSYAGIQLNEVFSAEEMRYWWDGSAWPAERVPRFIFPFYAWAPDEHYIIREVQRLKLLDPKKSSPLVTNNELIPVIGLIDVAKFGYSTFEPEFAQMIREGKTERHYWLNVFEMLEYSAKTGRFISSTVDQTLGKLGLTRADVGLTA